MKTLKEEHELLSLFNKQLEDLRNELSNIISRASEEDDWRLVGLNCLLTILQDDPAYFHRIWIEPLLTGGLSSEVAVACIANSYFLPN